MTYYILEKNGEIPTTEDYEKWAKFMASADRILKQESIEINGEDYWISTIFLGLDHSFDGETPILFETMVRGLREYGARCCTLGDALAQHARIREDLKANLQKQNLMQNDMKNKINIIKTINSNAFDASKEDFLEWLFTQNELTMQKYVERVVDYAGDNVHFRLSVYRLKIWLDEVEEDDDCAEMLEMYRADVEELLKFCEENEIDYIIKF